MNRLALGLFLLCACVSSPADDDHDGEDVGDSDVAGCGPVSITGDTACDACLATNCCTVIGNCVDASCSNVWDRSAVQQCTVNACADACGKEVAHCGGIQASPQSCAICVFDNCCEQATACGRNDACLAFIYQCLDRERSDFATCRSAFPEGASDFDALNDCGVAQCPGCF